MAGEGSRQNGPRGCRTLGSSHSWHGFSEATGTILTKLGHLPRITELASSTVHMPLILGKTGSESSSLQHRPAPPPPHQGAERMSHFLEEKGTLPTSRPSTRACADASYSARHRVSPQEKPETPGEWEREDPRKLIRETSLLVS